MIWRFETRENRELKDLTTAMNTSAAALLFLIVLIFIPSAGQAAQDEAVLFGHVRDARGRPAADALVTLRSSDGLFSLTAACDDKGSFDLCGIPPGEHTLSVERGGRQVIDGRILEVVPGATFYARIVLAADGSPAGARTEWSDLSASTGRTIIDELQVRSLPSADNVWSLIENQDLSATTNRIDVGGVWADLPALWSSRGSVSWTQSAYLLNGMDVSDPYASGTPMFYPDIFGLAFTEHSDGRHSIRNISPGGTFDLIPKQGTPDWHGAAVFSLTTSGMTTDRVPERLVQENLTERTRLNSLGDAAGQVAGPLVPGKLFLFASLYRLNVSRNVAEFSADDKGMVSSGLVNLTYLLPRGSLQFLWTGQIVEHPTYGAGRNVPVDSTVDQKNLFNVAQILLRTNLSSGHSLELGASYGHGDSRSDFQEGVSAPHGEEVFKKIPSGAAAAAGSDDRISLSLFGLGTAALRSSGSVRHLLEYGASLRYAASSSEERILDNIHLRFSGDSPFEIVRFNTPLTHGERALDVHVYVQDRLTFANLASLEVGLHAVKTKGWVPSDSSAGASPAPGFPAPPDAAGEISWFNLSPRLAFSLPLRRDGSLILRLSAARYFFELPLSYLAYGNPGAPGGLAYSWNDPNHDGRFEDGEQGRLVRREGPYFTSIDPGIERPMTDEFCVSFAKVFRDNLYLSLAGYYRETRHLVETLNVGVPLDAYDPSTLYDPGDDFIPGNADDLTFVVYNQKSETLGQDFFSLTNPDADSRVSRYRGLDLTLIKKFSRRTVFFFTGTATEAVGTTSPGNTEYENDDGVIGALYDNPNAAIEARGRLRFDRAYTARLGLSLPTPGGFRLSVLIKYYDGQPFARKIIVSGFNQGPFYIQAHYRANARYEFNMTVDIRLEKSIALGPGLARVFIEGYNIFDWANATQENEWTGPEFVLRYATEVQSPRVFRLGIAYEF
jgi:Carboxypeptidase regulatory-like domain